MPQIYSLPGLGNAMNPQGSQDGGQDVDAQLLLLQRQRMDELRRNAAMAAGSPDEGRLQALGQLLGGDIASNPLSKQQASIDAMEKANQAATQQGFTGVGGSPTQPSQMQAVAGRQAEMAKTMAPVMQEQEKQKGALAVEQSKETAAKQKLDLLQQMLSNPNIAPGTQIGAGGGISFRAPTANQISPNLSGKAAQDFEAKLQELTRLRTNPSSWDIAQDKAAQTSDIFAPNSIQRRAAAAESVLDGMKPNWRATLPANHPLKNPSYSQAAPQPASVPTAQGLRQRAINALKAHGLDENNEGYIQEAMRQLSGQVGQ